MAGLEANVKAAREHLNQGEKIISAVFGAYETKIMGNSTVRNGVFLATDQRLVFFGKKMFGYDMEVFPFANISSFEQGKGAMGHKIAFYSSGNKVTMKWINKGDVKKFVEYMHYIIGNRNPQMQGQPQPQFQQPPQQQYQQPPQQPYPAQTPQQPSQNAQFAEMADAEKPKWFDKKFWVFFWLIIFFPVGLYALWRNSLFSRNAKLIITAIVVVLVMIVRSPDSNKNEKESTSTQNSTGNSQIVQKQEDIPNYQIKHKIANHRADGGSTYFVLIPTVDLSNESFKADIKAMIKDVVRRNGKKISIDIYDDANVLDLYYRSHSGINTLGRVRTKAEQNSGTYHNVASFDGQLSTGFYKNTLYFFPGAFKKTPKVGEYVETVEFNP
jgi:hypothetical protein